MGRKMRKIILVIIILAFLSHPIIAMTTTSKVTQKQNAEEVELESKGGWHSLEPGVKILIISLIIVAATYLVVVVVLAVALQGLDLMPGWV